MFFIYTHTETIYTYRTNIEHTEQMKHFIAEEQMENLLLDEALKQVKWVNTYEQLENFIADEEIKTYGKDSTIGINFVSIGKQISDGNMAFLQKLIFAAKQGLLPIWLWPDAGKPYLITPTGLLCSRFAYKCIQEDFCSGMSGTDINILKLFSCCAMKEESDAIIFEEVLKIGRNLNISVYEKCLRLKLLGNTLYEAKDMHAALFIYMAGLGYGQKNIPKANKAGNKLKSEFANNAAMCQISCNEYHLAQQMNSLALEWQPDWPKALYIQKKIMNALQQNK